MEKKKTVRQWLETLPEPLKSSALKQADKGYLKLERLTLSSAISCFQYWAETKEDHYFWWSFYVALIWAEQLDNN